MDLSGLSPLELALQQLAKNVGVELTPANTNITSNDSINQNQQPKALLQKTEDYEEGELPEDGELEAPFHTSKLQNKQKSPKNKKNTVEKTKPPTQSHDSIHGSQKRPRATPAPPTPAFTGDVDAETLLRGLHQTKKPKKSPTEGTENKKKANKQSNSKVHPQLAMPKVPCRYWMEGKCSKGDTCTYSHANRPNKTAEEAKSQEVCRFHIAGTCLKGDACLFSHDLSRVPCKFYHLRGDCAAGDQCRFSHAPISDAERHALFMEAGGVVTAVRDPRLAGKVDALAPPSRYTPPPKIESPPPPSLPPRPASSSSTCTSHDFFFPADLDPRILKYNPFGSPFQ